MLIVRTVNLYVNGIHPIEWNKRAFDRLVLNPKTKELITALVEVRIAAGRAEDIIGGKGNGLMILLHGGPGTGKTLTAGGTLHPLIYLSEADIYTRKCR
jgi:DNA helicase TIP49 (TBP-interacting protein)